MAPDRKVDETPAVANKQTIVRSKPTYLSEGPISLQNITIIDGLGNPPKESATITIVDGRIKNIGTDDPLPDDAFVIDGSGLTVMPGLIDLHVHIGSSMISDGVIEYPRQKGLDALLYAGVTTVLDLGSDHVEVIEARDAIAEGKMRGPRIVATGTTIEHLGSVTSCGASIGCSDPVSIC